jgi:hypothetical protein
MAKTVKSVEAIAKSIKKTLVDEGVYSPVYDMSIADLAQVTHLKLIAFQDAIEYEYPTADEINADSKGRSVVVEQSREGFLRYKVNPAYNIYIDLVRESQKILDGLCMTAKSSNAIQDDEFEELKEKMKKAADE